MLDHSIRGPLYPSISLGLYGWIGGAVKQRRWTTSSMVRPDSFLEPDPVTGGMVAQPGLTDIRMSRARAWERYGRPEALRLYLLITS
jgi:hypothetical protein